MTDIYNYQNARFTECGSMYVEEMPPMFGFDKINGITSAATSATFIVNASNTMTPTEDVLYLIPFWLHHTRFVGSFPSPSFEVTTSGGVGSTVNMAIYGPSISNGVDVTNQSAPITRIGTNSIVATSSTGIKSGSFNSHTGMYPGLYWLGLAAQVNGAIPVLRSGGASLGTSNIIMGRPQTISSTTGYAGYSVAGITGTPPATITLSDLTLVDYNSLPTINF